jgi:trans-aconitate methyltransferase
MDHLATWDRQQELYIAGREPRFDALLDAIQWNCDRRAVSAPVVVDLGCGPAAIGQRLLTRFPSATYIGIDQDPVLLHLGHQALAGHPAERASLIDSDVAEGTWTGHLPADGVDVVCSSTALHWLTASQLTDCLAAAFTVLRPGGIVLNADNLSFTDQPSFTSLAKTTENRAMKAAQAAGALNWREWWDSVRADPEMTAFMAARDVVYPPNDSASDSEEVPPPLAEFLDSARLAGFSEYGTIWQRFDDRIVMAVKSSPR